MIFRFLRLRKDALAACTSAAALWTPKRRVASGWTEHAPFAFWVVEALRPRTLVELGTHSAYSYFAFCQAVQRLGLNTRCHAVDTWRGDEHSGFYGEEIFEEISRYQARQEYGGFSRFWRLAFDEALLQFEDGSIDLLHLDGRHYYEDVRHDFETWRPKLSSRAVVLFHDIGVHERDFGVRRFWDEVKAQYPHFEFSHGHGLGVLGVGARLPRTMRRLCQASANRDDANEIRQAYARLGASLDGQHLETNGP